jgi:hypothetical protein
MTVALEGSEWPAARPGRTLPPGKTWYQFYKRLGGSQGRPGWAENLVPTGIRSRTVQCPPVSQSNIKGPLYFHSKHSNMLKSETTKIPVRINSTWSNKDTNDQVHASSCIIHWEKRGTCQWKVGEKSHKMMNILWKKLKAANSSSYNLCESNITIHVTRKCQSYVSYRHFYVAVECKNIASAHKLQNLCSWTPRN